MCVCVCVCASVCASVCMCGGYYLPQMHSLFNVYLLNEAFQQKFLFKCRFKIITAYNAKIINVNNKSNFCYNCRVCEDYPLNSECLTDSVEYQQVSIN